MADIFTPNSLSIKQVFGDDKYYKIPPYQRPYSWNNEQIDELWDDLMSSFEENMEEYFLGSIIVSEPRAKGDKYLEVIDGQQRLTTLTILFCALRDLYYNGDRSDNTILARINSLEDKQDRLKLRTQRQNQNDFEQDIIKGINFAKKFKASELKENKFLNAAVRFREKIEPLTKDSSKLNKFKEYLLNNVKVILVVCTNPNFAMKLFNVLNTRGLDLTASDIIKSHLMFKIKNEEDIATFEQEWISIEQKAKEVEETIDNLFTYYNYYLSAKNPKKTLQEEIIKEFEKGESLEIIRDFKNFVDFYLSIYTKKSKVIYSLRYLNHEVYWKSIILSSKMMDWEDKDIERLAKILRKYYYLYWLADYTVTKIKQTSFNMIGWIKSGKDIDFIDKEIEKRILEDNVVTRLSDNFNGNAYDTAWCKPLLILIEYEQVDSSSQDYIEIDRNIQVEHILPREFRKDPYWLKRFTEDSAMSLVNSLGNLTLLSGKKNIAASCNSFHKKVENNYKGKGEDGITGFVITQNIVNDSAKETVKEWDEEKIKSRKEWILSEVERIFRIKFERAKEDESSFAKYGKLLNGKFEWKDKGKLLWKKPKLAASDVERSPGGNVTGRLKLVKSSFKIGDRLIDQTSYFRNNVFGNLEWSEKEHTGKEIAEAIFVIKSNGKELGIHRLTIGHNPLGEADQNNYTTHISWGSLSETIKNLNLTGRELCLYAPPIGQKEPYYMEIN